MCPKLCLGSAQFGFDYGITNKKGQPNQSEINQILEEAYCSGISFIDTAQAYGNAEILLGKSNLIKDKFNIINKFTSEGEDFFDSKIISKLEDNFIKSLSNLNVSHLDSFLLHDYKDLLKPKSQRLIDWLLSLRERDLVRRIGVSIYDIDDLNQIPLRFLM